jgi:hypothetical protein
VGTPLTIPSKDFIDIGKIASIEINDTQVDMATKGQMVTIKVGIILSPNVYLIYFVLSNVTSTGHRSPGATLMSRKRVTDCTSRWRTSL